MSEVQKLMSKLRSDRSLENYLGMSAHLNQNKTAFENGLQEYKIAVLRNFSIEPLQITLDGELALAGKWPVYYWGNYNSIAVDVFNSNSDFYQFNPSIIIIGLWLETISPILSKNMIRYNAATIESEIDRVLEVISSYIGEVRNNTKVPIILNNFPLPGNASLGILDAMVSPGEFEAIALLNIAIRKLTASFSNVYIIDYARIFSRLGEDKAIDARNWLQRKAPISRHALVPVGREYGRLIGAMLGKSKKCLVLDCDNTLWKGVIGEDGLSGIEMGQDGLGAGFRAFQNVILNLYHRGVILAICSKNNENDVMSVLENHPDMLLRKEHFSCFRINWQDKVTNLREIAISLNIGLDSLVFIDDSAFECEWVRKGIPEVEVVELPKNSSTYEALLMQCGHFDSLSFSSEDRFRTEMYRADAKRKEIRESTPSYERFLLNLEIHANICCVDETMVPRVSQLTQKTNQFNMTTVRYSQDEIREFIENKDIDIFLVSLSDKVSDLGVIGVAIVIYQDCQAIIDTFLLSCRALGRGVEDALIFYITEKAKIKGSMEILASYHETAKNHQVKNYWREKKFNLINKNDNGEQWRLDMREELPIAPKWIHIN